jgi:hypothetical protein
MGYLGYAALAKSRSPIVSHSQAAAASLAIVGELQADERGKPRPHVKVVESLTANGPSTGADLFISNLGDDVRGFEGAGQYLLLLKLPSYELVAQLRSPGTPESAGGRRPAVYRWSEDVRKQYEKLQPKQ